MLIMMIIMIVLLYTILLYIVYNTLIYLNISVGNMWKPTLKMFGIGKPLSSGGGVSIQKCE